MVVVIFRLVHATMRLQTFHFRQKVNAWLREKVYSYLFCIHTFVWFSDSSLDLSTSAEHVEANSSNMDQSLRTPFTGDLGVISNRSSIVSQVNPPFH